MARRIGLCVALLAVLQPIMPTLAAAAAQEPADPHACDHEGGQLLLHRPDDATTPVNAAALAHRLHETLLAWSAAPGGCHGEVVFEGMGHCGKTYELPGAYNFHGHAAKLVLTFASTEACPAPSHRPATTTTGVCDSKTRSCGAKHDEEEEEETEAVKAGRARVVSLHSERGVYLFRFTGGASVHARGIGFQGGTGKWGGAVELSGEGKDGDSSFEGCVFDHDLAVSSGGAVIVEGAIDPGLREPTTARFHDCVFTHNAALQGGAIYIAPTTPGRARVELEGCTFEGNEAFDDGGAVYVGGDLVLKGKRNRFSGNAAGHHDPNVYVQEPGGRVIREE